MPNDLQIALSRLREEFITHLPERMTALQALLDALEGGDFGSLKPLHHAAHSLTGTAGTHGLMQIYDAARALEKITTSLPCNDNEHRALHAAFDELARCAAHPVYDLIPPPLKKTTTARIIVVEDDIEQAAWLRSVLEGAGYQVDVFGELAPFRAALLEQELPAAVIMDMVFPEGDEAGAQVIAEMKTQSLNVLPVIFLSVRNDMAARLAAHRAGATRYMTKPVERAALLRVISASAALTPKKPYRILIVDDSKSQLAVHAHMLREAGMEVREALNPLAVLDTLEEFPAELLLLDMHMPQCSGPELAAILHDDERYTDIPIVYLSAETNVALQLLALDRGGDHFLVKPVNQKHMVSVIGMHVRRQRQSKEKTEALQAIRYMQERQRQAFDTYAIISTTDSAGIIIDTNEKFCKISGYTREELLGNNHRIVKSSRHSNELYSELWDTISSGKTWQGEICNRAKDGHLYWVQTSIVPFLDKNGIPYQYISIRTDITLQKSVELALLDARDAAESASRAKSEFLASMSHELRTPLNAILGFSQLFTMDTQLPDETREDAREIERAGQHLLALINDMIDLARIEAGKLSLSLDPVQIKDVLKDSLSLVDSLANKRGIRLIELACSNQDVTVQADHLRLRQVLINLITNAIKYNCPKGTVSLSCTLNNDKVRISVVDTGNGIPADKQARIFNSFDRLGAERGHIEGTGIGLVITKRIVEAMGGEIGFESSVGLGSTFWVEFPLATNIASLPLNDEALITTPTISPQTIRPRVLYIEDNPMNFRLMQQIFEKRKNLELLHANTAENGIALALSQPPALILMDINLPGMDGYAALNILKADSRTAMIPVIAVTANAMKGDDNRGMDSGFQDYLTKPLNLAYFLAILDKMF